MHEPSNDPGFITHAAPEGLFVKAVRREQRRRITSTAIGIGAIVALFSAFAGAAYTNGLATSETQGVASAPSEAAQRVIIMYHADEVAQVSVAGTFNNWNPEISPLLQTSPGQWRVVLDLPPGVYEYQLVVDGEWRVDPLAVATREDGFGAVNGLLVL